MSHVFQVMKHLDDETNENIIESSHKESMHGNFVNFNDMIIAVKNKKYKDIKKDTKGVDGVGDNIFHPL